MTLKQIKQFVDWGYSDYEIQKELESLKKEYPKKPVAPTLKSKHTPEDVIEYAEKLKQYEVLNWEYLEEKSGLLDFDDETQKLITSFHYDVFSQGNGVVQYYQEIETVVNFVHEIKNYDN